MDAIPKKKITNLGDFILEDEPPLKDTIEEIPVSFPAKDGKAITAILSLPKDKPVTQKALFLHEIEGHKDGGTMRVISRRYADMGIATLRIDFRGHGDRKDLWQEYGPRSMYNDSEDALNWLDERFPQTDKTMLCGFSTGGGIAILLRDMEPERISKLCLLYPVLSFKYNFLAAAYPDDLLFRLEEWDAETPWRANEFTKEKIQASLQDDKPFSLIGHTYGAGFIKGCKDIIDRGLDIIDYALDSGRPPMTIIQGTVDGIVPVSYARFLYGRAEKEHCPIKYVEIMGMNHWVPRQYKPAVLEHFKNAALEQPEDFKPEREIVFKRIQTGFSSLHSQPQ